MPIPAVVENSEALAKLPEAIRGEYTERDGKFFANVTPYEGEDAKYELVNTSALSGALEAKKGRLRELKGTLEAYSALGEPEDLRHAVEIAEKFKDFDEAKVDEKYKALAEQKLDKARTDHETETAALKRQIHGLTVGRDITDALVGARVKPEYKAVAEKLLGESVDLREVDGKLRSVVLDDDGEIVTAQNSMKPLSVSEKAATLVAQYPDMFLGANAGGGGASGDLGSSAGGGTITRLSQLDTEAKRTEYATKNPKEYRKLLEAASAAKVKTIEERFKASGRAAAASP